LALFQKVQKNNLTIWEFESVVMGGWFFFVDLAEDRSPVVDRAFTPWPHTLTPDFVCEGQFRAGLDTNGNTRIFRRAEASCTGFEKMRG
jgi:hypothetical protein